MLRVLAGPMFAGKTTRLRQHVVAQRDRFDAVAVAKWCRDSRFGAGGNELVTHSGLRLDHGVRSVGALRELELPRPGTRLLLAVDEAQFFPDLLELWRRFRERSTRGDLMIVAGLDLDFRGERFGSVLDLVDACERDGAPCELEQLVARCYACGGPASLTMRTAAAEDQVLVGGADLYQPACAEHHKIPASAVAAYSGC